MAYPIESPAWDDRLRREIRLFLHHAGSSQAALGEYMGCSASYVNKTLKLGAPIPAQFIDSLDKHAFFKSIAREYHYVKIAAASDGEEREVYRAKALDCYNERSARLAAMLSDLLAGLENEVEK